MLWKIKHSLIENNLIVKTSPVKESPVKNVGVTFLLKLYISCDNAVIVHLVRVINRPCLWFKTSVLSLQTMQNVPTSHPKYRIFLSHQTRQQTAKSININPSCLQRMHPHFSHCWSYTSYSPPSFKLSVLLCFK